MSDEGINLPIGADLSDLQKAFSQIQGHVVKMGERVNKSLGRSNAAFARTSSAGARIGAALTKAWQSATAAARRALTGMVGAARGAVARIGGAFRSIASLPGKIFSAIPGLKTGGLLGGLGALAGAVGFTIKSIGKAAEMESLEAAFAPLLGSAEAARARIAELSRFAAATPFEMPEIARASRMLEVLTRGALSSGDALRMVGDVAAGAQAPFEEIAMWVGRLYDGLQSGRPVGEAMMRLQELGIISGEVRGQLEALQKSGASGNEVWEAARGALDRFGGSMERQAATWNGKLSTLRDNVGLLMAEFGAPIVDSLKPFLDMAISKVDSLKVKFSELGENIKAAFNTGLAAFQTGKTTELFAVGLELAIVKGINKLWAGITGSIAFLQNALPGLFKGLHEGLRMSGLLGAIESFLTGLAKKFGAAILDALSNVRGMGDLKEKANVMRAEAGAEMYFAKREMESLDFATGLSIIKNEWSKWIGAGLEEFQNATLIPLLDESKTKEKYRELNKELRKQADANLKAQDDTAAAMDARLKKPETAGATDDAGGKPAAQPIRPLGTLTTALGRVGGGGFGMTFFPMISEQKRANNYLRELVKNSKGRSQIPVLV